jgi:hypothetical protein
MPKVSVAVPHNLDPDEVVQRAEPYIKKMIDDFEGHDVYLQWEGRKANFGFSSMMFKIKGEMEVREKEIAIDIDLPIAALMFKDKVQKAITKNLTRAINGEPLPDDSQS